MHTPSVVELRFFEAASRTGSFSAAARELGVTQQAVSSRVRGLERLLGLHLAERSPAGIVATTEGRRILDSAADMLTAAQRLDRTIAELRHEPSLRSLRVGASQTISAHLLPGWLLELRLARAQSWPAMNEVALHTENSARIIALVRDGTLDLGFIETPRLPRNLGCSLVATDRLIVAVCPSHVWADREALSPDEICNTPLVTRELGSGTREAFEDFLTGSLQLYPAAPLLALGTEAAVRSAVTQGVGPAVLSEHTVRDDVRLGRINAVPLDPPITRPFSAIWRGSRRDLAGAARQLVSIAAKSGSGTRVRVS